MQKVLYASYGYTTHDRRFLKFFSDNNWDVLFVRFDGSSHQIDNRPLPNGVTTINWLGTNEELTESNTGKFIEATKSLVEERNVDLVVAGPIHTVGYVCASSLNIPLVIVSWAFDLLIEIKHSAINKQRAMFAIAKAKGLIADCRTVEDIAVTLGANSKDILIIPWGVELEKFQMRRTPPANQVFKVLSIRSLEEIYDVPTLIYAVAHLSNQYSLLGRIAFTIAGDGSEKEFLHKLAIDLGVNDYITWIGRVSENELPELFSNHNLYVSTSKSDGSSVSMLQALATGLPVLVANIDSNLEWIDDGWNGWVFALSDSVDFAEKIMRISSISDFSTIQLNGRTTVEQRANWKTSQTILNSYLLDLVK